ncbi:MAG: hypothetical protein K5751_00975 [Treponemataceae bacterium]|jgi:hypothetical protein|nr:hypothetical protein [Treponemataceae bacterium]
MQFYFLSVFFNMLVGLSLTFSGFKFAELFPGKEKIVKMVIGIAAVFVGVMKFAFVVQPDYVVVGDLLPAVVGIAGGICYIIECMNSNPDEPTKPKIQMKPFFENLFIKGKKYIGIVCIVTAVIHFIFPTLSII